MAVSLAALLPRKGETLPTDEILSRFVGWTTSLGLELYPAQEEAILELLGHKHLVLATPTGSGKSLVATALHFKAMAEGKTSFYTCPIKALVNEKFFALCDAFGAESVGMITGDASINREAPIVCCTAEVLANLCLREAKLAVDAVVMDEFHYYADRDRGVAWQIPLLLLERTTFLLMSATLGDMSGIATSLEKLTGREVAQVRSAQRPVPLDFEYRETPLNQTIEALIATRREPIYLVNFSQRAAAERAQDLVSANLTTREEKEALKGAMEGVKLDTPYGKEMQRFLRAGIGVHHAGLLPKYRLLVEKLAQQGLLKVVSGTDTLGVGVNIPIRTVLFTQLCKFDGAKTGVLSVRDFLQVSGRAGRKGFDDRGSVVAQAPEHVIENARLAAKAAGGKKVVKKQAPTRGYAHWDRATFERLRTQQPEPLESRFDVTHGLLLNLLQSDNAAGGGGYRRLLTLIARAHTRDTMKVRFKRSAAQAFRRLRAAGLIELVKRSGRRGRRAQVSPDLQADFSLNHTLSLWLLEALPQLDRAAETWAQDVLSLVESILEDPGPVLYAQIDRAKTERLAELKAQGMDYSDRINELEKVTHPKPLADFIYASFDRFEAQHPWVGAQNIRPKSVAREMVVTAASFDDYVRDYGLQRSEGVLLRYLGDAYKTLVQNVPEAMRDDALEDVIAFLRALVRGIDSSLLDEWERLRSGALPPELAARLQQPAAPQPKPIDRRTLAARIRTDLHRLLTALARKRYDEAAAALRPGWTAGELEAAMAPYWAEHAGLDVTPRARRPDKTFIRETGPERWEARQKIVDPEGDEDWMLDCTVEGPLDGDAPLISLLRIGT